MRITRSFSSLLPLAMPLFNWIRSTSWRLATRVLPLLLGGLASLAVLLLWHQLNLQEGHHIRQITQHEATMLEVAIGRELTNRVQALQRMADHWQAAGSVPQAVWEADAAAYIRDFYGFQAIEWVDPSFHVRWVVPMAGNETVVNLDLSREFRRKTALTIARDLRQPIVTSTVTLTQGGRGILVNVPILVSSAADTAAPPRLDGFIVAVFRFPALFDGILRLPEGFQARIYNGSELIYSSANIPQPDFHQVASIETYSVNWRLEIFPTPAFIAQEKSALPQVVLLGGMLGAWTLAAIVYLGQRSRRYAQRARKINQQLQTEIFQRQQAEARFQAFMNHSPTPAWITDANGIMIYASQTYFRTFQLPTGDIIGKSIFELFPAQFAQQFLANIQTVANTQQMLETVEVAPYANGTPGDFLVYKFPIPSELGAALVGGVAIDITRQHQVEEALRQSEATKQGIIQAIPDLLVRMRSDGTYLDCITSHEFTALNADLIRPGANNSDVLPPHLAKLRQQHVQRALELGKTEIYEQEIFIQGQHRYEEVRIVPLLPDEVLVMVRDISDRKQAEEALRHQKEMFQTIVDHIPVMICLYDAQGQLEFINPETERILGWSIAAWQQEDILAHCYPDPDYRQRVLNHMLAATGAWMDMTSVTASRRQIETTWLNMKLSDGRFLGIGQDITDRKHKELELQQAVEAAESANLAKSIFLANMSHELRTPLNVILGFAQVMAHDSALTPGQRDDLQTIRRSGDHLLSLINDILDLSKIESGHYTVTPTEFNVAGLLHALQQMLAERAASKQLQLDFEIAPDVPQFIVADDQKLRQVLLNLLSNAIKFTERGSVRLRVGVIAPSPVSESDSTLLAASPSSQSHLQPTDRLPTDRLPTMLQFTVTDTGMGIAPEELETIFNAFVQAQAGKQSGCGTGLGLTISRKLLELMGGHIAVTSTLGQGSTFTFTLPAAVSHAVGTPSEQSDRLVVGLAPGQPQRRILVVDDQPENRLLLVRLLTQIGLEVKSASNGQEAIQRWQDWHPHLIWMDIRMPEMDGYETTRWIRAQEQQQGSAENPAESPAESPTIIIALTAQASESDRALALAAGCNDYMSKPFQEKALLLKMQQYLGLAYLYDSADSPTQPSSHPSQLMSERQLEKLDAASLALLPPKWLDALQDAALCGNDQAIVDLVSELPPALSPLGAHLIELADKYQFERILQWVESQILWGLPPTQTNPSAPDSR